ncbi:MAG: DUF2905 domain-containing protein [Pseudomonadales bacterium]|jgi:hypothetical protein|nr:DUF2905 domain-containing protein [Pseudomonadales bacterium]MDP6471459.1 DUF2905 domain-containing protein [Pseudomonadales bacterium]MDP6828628.1 DUF2905 domain-containing protein [Pseudomonadales bacterium]MDP6972347.1 DUF2905 domain-containing protein [Pseudomonadales bacterium]|tara:strand:- start:811 stop:1017 length:207 start_codon:yes stop_codon:yes gene_type:complete
MGKWLVIAGSILIVVGLLVSSGALSWFGKLPGDIRIERGNLTIFLPITSMLLTSIALSLLAQLVKRFW